MNHESASYKVFKVCNYIFMCIIFVICIFPYLNVLAKALNDGNDTMRGGITIFPRVFTWQNFSTLLKDTSMYSAAVVTIVRVVVGTLLGLSFQFAAGYALSHEDLVGRKKFMLFIIIPSFISGGTIPTYILFSASGLLDNFLVYILPAVMSYYNVIVIRSYIESSVPKSLGEAASLEGAGELRILWSIVLPLCKPILATVALWIAVGHWNDWSTTMYYITDERLFTLQYKLMEVIKESERIQNLLREAQAAGTAAEINVRTTPDALISAQVIITTVPIILVYPWLQKYFVKGVTLGSVK